MRSPRPGRHQSTAPCPRLVAGVNSVIAGLPSPGLYWGPIRSRGQGYMAVEDAPSSAGLRRENARLRGELAAMRDELARARAHEAEALEQQAAASRVLQVLGGSRSD